MTPKPGAGRAIVVRGAHEHNLKGIDVTIPRGTLTTITGVSGSGKSSLAFDTIYREGQRRFLESLSAYARQFLGEIEKPKVDHVEGLSPTLSIDQKTVNRNPRSTVGTVTEIFDHLRLLFARLGTPHCASCGAAVTAFAPDQIVDTVLAAFADRDVLVLAPVVRERKGEYRKELEEYRLKGFVRARIDGTVKRLDEGDIRLARYKKHTIELVIDRVKVGPEKRSRIAEAVEQAIAEAGGLVAIVDSHRVADAAGESDRREFGTKLGCPKCGTSLPEIEPRLFSFNTPEGACPECLGLGLKRRFDAALIVPDPALSIRGRAIAFMTGKGWFAHTSLGLKQVEAIGRVLGFTLDQPWKSIPKAARDTLLYGSGERVFELPVSWQWSGGSVKGMKKTALEGMIPALERAHRERPSSWHEKFMRIDRCGACGGSRLRPEARGVLFRGKTIADMVAMTVEAGAAFFDALALEPREEPVGRPIVKEIRARLLFLEKVGLSYLSIDRSAATLSGGEAQRIRLAAQVGAGLRGVLYVLDEPSIGLHARDNRRLLESLHELRDAGNTVIVVEHDRETMEASDHVVDVGPGAGRDGGEIVAQGTVEDLVREPRSITGRYLSGEKSIPVPEKRRAPRKGRAVVVRGARENNLRNLTVAFPTGLLTVVTGVSGSGKSTLVLDVLKKALAKKLHGAEEEPGAHGSVTGFEKGEIDKVVEIDQSPIGRTPRSNPATYTGVFDEIRKLFAMMPESRSRGWKEGRFSFNVSGGRCEECGGAGVKVVEMQFLADVEVPCEACGGRRFNRETLDVRFKGKTITDVLEMRISEALPFFAGIPKVRRVLETLDDVGLSYVALGQPSTTLSGGEAQRMKLATELHRVATGKTLYVLDEPTTGLHFDDVAKLVRTLQRLVEGGNTVVVIEHNLDVIRAADWLVDLGPEGGTGGGRLVAEGTPEDVARVDASATGQVLRAQPLRPCRPRSQQPPEEGGAIRIFGARKNNLKGVDVEIPHERLTVITGVSGSGKTSLAFDTLFAEGQRRFVEALSTYARRFLGRFDKAPVDRVEGLSPAIAIDQKVAARNPRSTVATSTEIYDYLRLLYARLGTPHCPSCRVPLRAASPTSAAEDVARGLGPAAAKILVTAPLFLPGRPGGPGSARRLALERASDLPPLAEQLKKEGFLRLLVGDAEVRLDAPGALPKPKEKDAIRLVVDRTVADAGRTARLAEALEQAFEKGHGLAHVLRLGADGRPAGKPVVFSREPECAECGFRLDPNDLSPRLFSFNSHAGACPDCLGLGSRLRVDEEKLVSRPDRPFLGSGPGHEGAQDVVREGTFYGSLVRAAATHGKIDIEKPWRSLGAAAQRYLLDGPKGGPVTLAVKHRVARKDAHRDWKLDMEWGGLVPLLERRASGQGSGEWPLDARLEELFSPAPCAACGGGRLKPLALAVTVGGKNVSELCRLSVAAARAFVSSLQFGPQGKPVAEPILQEIESRLLFLDEVGLAYLSLDRASSTLSGGEAQRIRLASQIGSRLVGVLYVLDEPTIGLHPRDTGRLLATLRSLRDLGNTVVVVEHDEEAIRAADKVIDVGPLAGARGGEIVAQGDLAAILASERSLTGAYLSGRLKPPVRSERRGAPDGEALVVRGARANNLKGIDAAFPLRAFTAVTGVSGSGKSSLVMDVLRESLEDDIRRRGRAKKGQKPKGALEGASKIDRLRVIDQAPIGRTPASNPATYSGVFDPVRDLFAEMPQSRAKGYTRARFSFNTGAGRCPACEGKGHRQVEMHFLSDVWIPCEVCDGRRYDKETLLVTYRGKTIADVLEMEVGEAAEFFANVPKVKPILDTLAAVGLAYLRLGQPANTLSGGEAQRLKLATELAIGAADGTLYLLDEPTTGLHFADVHRLIDVLRRLVDAGSTVVVIEHNLDVMRAADWIVDMGPEGGDEGGRVVAAGTPDEIAANEASHTGRALRGAAAARGRNGATAAAGTAGSRG